MKLELTIYLSVEKVLEMLYIFNKGFVADVASGDFLYEVDAPYNLSQWSAAVEAEFGS